MALGEDASQPAAVQAMATSATTASFSPPAGSLLIALAAYGSGGSGTTTGAITSSPALTWTLQRRTNTSGEGCSDISTTYLATAPGSMTVTATGTASTSPTLLVVRVITGAGQIMGANSTSSTSTGNSTITTTVIGSMVYGVLMDNSNNDTLTVQAGTTSISVFQDASDGEACAVYKSTAATSSPGSTSFGYTGPANPCLKSLLELLPAIGPSGLVIGRTAVGRSALW